VPQHAVRSVPQGAAPQHAVPERALPQRAEAPEGAA